LITTGDDDDPGIPGALSSRYDLNTTVCSIEVPSITEYARKITQAGGRVVAPQITIPGEGFVQYCEDLEGNGFAIIEYVEETE
jgi:predicted enzyme related to lactoylglutathione lyase